MPKEEKKKVETLTASQFLQKQVVEMDERTQFVGEKMAFGKEVNRRLTEDGVSPYEQLGIMRKAIMHLITKHGDENDPELAEFIAFDEKVEQIKSDIHAEQEAREEH